MYNGPDNGSDVGAAIAASDSGYVYVTGNGFATIKHNNSRVQKWIVRHNGPANQDDHALSLALDG